DARKRAYCLKIQPATGSFARNLIYSTKPRHAPSINKPQRSLNEEDMLEAIIKLQGSSEAIFGKR
ncbi:hypothetical protein, partial [Klebsiella michiganensis]|uniref:hypothetical protein n=2 Tax=Klebsiella TaxID=570 RepID=UPI0011E66F1B